MKPKFIHFVEGELAFGYPAYSIRNNKSGAELGQIGWYPAWRQYAAHFEDNTVWSQDCLADVRAFIQEKNAENKP